MLNITKAVSIIFTAVVGCLLTLSAVAEKVSFEVWLERCKDDAVKAGVKRAIAEEVMDGVTLDPTVIKLDRKQPEFTTAFEDYVEKRVSPARVSMGLTAIDKNRRDLFEVAQQYGVQPRFIVAIWGAESNYGTYPMKFDIIRSLATLAYDARRSEYFKKELINALKIIDQGHIGRAEMKGSWAGAMGQTQFMPSSYLKFAQDFDNDGRADIWQTPRDVFASIAFYLKEHGWSDDVTWGRPVAVPADFKAKNAALFDNGDSASPALRRHTKQLPLGEWNALGVRRLNGRSLPRRNLLASLVQPGGNGGVSYLTYDNYRALLKYNASNYYAISIGLLSDKFRQP